MMPTMPAGAPGDGDPPSACSAKARVVGDESARTIRSEGHSPRLPLTNFIRLSSLSRARSFEFRKRESWYLRYGGLVLPRTARSDPLERARCLEAGGDRILGAFEQRVTVVTT